MRPLSSARRRPLVAAIAVVGVAVGLSVTGCTVAPAPSPSASPSASSSPSAAAPAFHPDGTAADNLPLFTSVMNGVATSKKKVQGRAYVDALVKAGFPKAQMEVTKDRTSVGNPADSIQFSVRWDGDCLVGQVGPSTPEPTALVLPLLPGGTCLIGDTRAIDW